MLAAGFLGQKNSMSLIYYRDDGSVDNRWLEQEV